MKRCPTCEKTFDDSMRFCQSDGTPLIEDAEPIDPYKTMVARPGDFGASVPKGKDEVLDLPEQDESRKTMYASEDEIRGEMSKGGRDEQLIDIPPLTEEPGADAGSQPGQTANAEQAPPPSPFSSEPEPERVNPFSSTTPPIPSPFDEPKPPTPFEPKFKEPERPAQAAYREPDPIFDPAPSSVQQAEWNPPAIPDTNWQEQQIGQNAAFQPTALPGGKNQTLAIISLVTGIFSFLCCNWFIVGAAAVVMGFIAKGKADSNPNEYGGRGLAMGGIITGGISMLVGALVWILYMMGFMASLLGNSVNF